MELDAALWDGLPSEMVERVLAFLPVPDLCRYRRCKTWDVTQERMTGNAPAIVRKVRFNTSPFLQSYTLIIPGRFSTSHSVYPNITLRLPRCSHLECPQCSQCSQLLRSPSTTPGSAILSPVW